MEILEGRVVLTQMAALTVVLFVAVLALSLIATILVTLRMPKSALGCLTVQGVCVFLMPMTFTLWVGPLMAVLAGIGIAKLFYDEKHGLK